MVNYEKNVANQLLVEKVVDPLLKIVYEYKESSCYSYIPGTKEDGWDYYESRFNDIYRGLNQNVFISEELYEKVNQIIDDLKTFVRKYECANSLSERILDANDNLYFFTVAHYLLEMCGVEWFDDFVENSVVSVAHVPEIQEQETRKQYFERKNKKSEKMNLKHDEDDFFIEELALAIRRVFIELLNEV